MKCVIFTLHQKKKKNRWALFNNYISNITLKHPLDTRWESRIEAVRFSRYQLGEIDALYEIMESRNFTKV